MCVGRIHHMKNFCVEIPLRWGDMDAMGHVNNTVYFRLMEELRIQWFVALGLSTLPIGQGPILAHASCDFIKQLNYPGIAVVSQKVQRLGRSSIETSFTIGCTADPEALYASGKAISVFYDYDIGKSLPWPDSVRAAIEGATSEFGTVR